MEQPMCHKAFLAGHVLLQEVSLKWTHLLAQFRYSSFSRILVFLSRLPLVVLVV